METTWQTSADCGTLFSPEMLAKIDVEPGSLAVRTPVVVFGDITVKSVLKTWVCFAAWTTSDGGGPGVGQGGLAVAADGGHGGSPGLLLAVGNVAPRRDVALLGPAESVVGGSG